MPNKSNTLMKKHISQFLQFLIAIPILSLLAIATARAADPVITDPTKTSIGVVTGGDTGEGLDLEGTFVYALAVGEQVDTDIKIRDATFVKIDLDPEGGASIRAS